MFMLYGGLGECVLVCSSKDPSGGACYHGDWLGVTVL